MAMPFLRRLLLPLAVFLRICKLLSNFSGHQQYHIALYFSPRSNSLYEFQSPAALRTTGSTVILMLWTTSMMKSASKAGVQACRKPLSEQTLPFHLLSWYLQPVLGHQIDLTGHTRLPNLLCNVSMEPRSTPNEEKRRFWNPMIVAIPYWAKNQYLIVCSHSKMYLTGETFSAKRTFAILNLRNETTSARKFARMRTWKYSVQMEDYVAPVHPSTLTYLQFLHRSVRVWNGVLQICLAFMIPGRVFYSGRGEPILMISSQ